MSETGTRRARLPARVILAIALLVNGLAAHSGTIHRPTPTATRPSTADVAVLTSTPVDRTHAIGARDRFRIPLDSGDYVRIVVVPSGIDVAASLLAPDDGVVVQSLHRQPGPIVLSAVAERAGHYSLEVRPLDTVPVTGSYRVAIEETRRAESRDREHVVADRLFLDAERLKAEWTLESSSRALEQYRDALQHWKAADDRSRAALAARKVGETYLLLGKPDDALSNLVESVQLARQVKNAEGQCAALNSLARAQIEVGRIPDATATSRDALDQCRQARARSGEADALNVLGDTFQSSGHGAESLNFFRQALDIYRNVLDRRGQAQALLNLGFAYTDLGRGEESRKSHEEALALWRSVDDRRGEAATRTALGHLLVALGENQEALSHYQNARHLFERLGDRLGLASVMNGIGTIHYRSGDTDTAITSFRQGAEMFHAIKQPSGEATSLMLLGVALTGRGNDREAVEQYARALTLARGASNKIIEARSLELVAYADMHLGNLAAALEHFRNSRSIAHAIGFQIGEVYALNGIGEVLNGRGQHREALAAFADSVAMSQRLQHPFAESLGLYNLATTEAALGHLENALARIRDSLDRVEGLRSDVASLDLRASYLASVRDRHELYVDLLMQMEGRRPRGDYTTLAFEATERARARSFLDDLAQARAGIREGIAPDLRDREAAIRRSLNASARRLMQRQNNAADANEVAALTAQVDQERAAYTEIEAQIRAASPRYASLTQPKPLTLSQVQALIQDDRTVLLQYFLGANRSYVWAVTRHAIAGFSLPSRNDIEARVRAYRTAVTVPAPAEATMPSGARRPEHEARSVGALAVRKVSVDLQQSAVRVGEMLLGPVAQYLTNARVIVVADGILNLIPFAALPDPRHASSNTAPPPLVAEHEVVNLPSASTLALLRGEWNQERHWQKPAIVFADPVYERDDPRMAAAPPSAATEEASETRALGGVRIARLKQTGREAQSIAALASATDVALAFDANRTAAMTAAFQNYRIVHFAAHGIVDDHRPELSGIALSLFDRNGQPQDGFLRLHDIYNLKVPADLVVLSACSTALGKDIVGEGLIGLVRGFMYAGSRRVVASLWEVDDEATSELMTRFYRGMFVKKLTPPAALRAAQVELMRETKWKAPFYWAAFVLQGDWN